MLNPFKNYFLKRELKQRKIEEEHLSQPDGYCIFCASSEWHIDAMRRQPNIYFAMMSLSWAATPCPLRKRLKKTDDVLDSIKVKG